MLHHQKPRPLAPPQCKCWATSPNISQWGVDKEGCFLSTVIPSQSPNLHHVTNMLMVWLNPVWIRSEGLGQQHELSSQRYLWMVPKLFNLFLPWIWRGPGICATPFLIEICIFSLVYCILLSFKCWSYFSCISVKMAIYILMSNQ